MEKIQDRFSFIQAVLYHQNRTFDVLDFYLYNDSIKEDDSDEKKKTFHISYAGGKQSPDQEFKSLTKQVIRRKQGHGQRRRSYDKSHVRPGQERLNNHISFGLE